MIRKKVKLITIAVLCSIILTSLLLFVFNNRINVNEVESVDVILMGVFIHDTFYENTNFQVFNESDITNVIDMETKIRNTWSVIGFNLAPWTIKIEYKLKNGIIIKRKYSKAVNDHDFFSPFFRYVK